MSDNKTVGYLHNPEALRKLAQQLRDEAERCEAQAMKVERGEMERGCLDGCFYLRSSCFFVTPM